VQPPAGKSCLSLPTRHPFEGVLDALCAETGQTASGKVDVVGCCSHHANQDADPTFTLFPGAVVLLTEKGLPFLVALSRLFIPSCRKDRAHFLAHRLTEKGELTEPPVWYIRKVKKDILVVGHLNRDEDNATWVQLTEMRASGVEAKVVAGNLAEDARREDNDAALKGKSPEQAQGGKRSRTPRSPRLDPSIIVTPQSQKGTRKVDTEDTDTDSDVERSCSACEGVFNDSCREDQVRFKCRRCVPGVLLCGSCVVEHRATFKGHRCKKQHVKKPKRTKPNPKKERSTAGGAKSSGGGVGAKSSAGGTGEDIEDHGSVPGQARGMSDKAVVAMYEGRRACWYPQEASEAKIADLKMQIQIAKLQSELVRAKSGH
jgi:hypothetical protein